MPKISAIIPVYNGEKYLKEAIDSILAQTFTDFELIIVDDCSTDSTPDIIKAYTDNRIKYLRNEKNLKISDTLNYGIENSCGEYIARMDADDISLPNRFEKQIEYLEKNKDVYLLGSDLLLFFEDNKTREFIVSHDYNDIKSDLIFASPLAHPSVMMRSSLFKEEGLRYNAEYNGLEDYVLFFNIALKHKVAALDEILFKYRVHPAQITQNYSDSYLNKLIKFKKMQFEKLNINLTDSELRTFVLTSCVNDSDYFGIDFKDIALTYKKIIKNITFADKKAIRKILTDKLIAFSKYYLCGVKEFNKVVGKEFSKPQVLIFRLRQALKKPYLKLEMLKTRLATNKDRRKLKNRDFTIISNNCYAGNVYRKYGLEYLTPTAGIVIKNEDYIKFCKNLKNYLGLKLEFIPCESSKYGNELKEFGKFPVANLGDVEIDFVHYKTAREAEIKWYRRAKRVNYNNIAFKYSRRSVSTKECEEEFLRSDLINKMCFTSTHKEGGIYVEGIDELKGDEYPLVSKYFDVTGFINTMKRTTVE